MMKFFLSFLVFVFDFVLSCFVFFCLFVCFFFAKEGAIYIILTGNFIVVNFKAKRGSKFKFN